MQMLRAYILISGNLVFRIRYYYATLFLFPSTFVLLLLWDFEATISAAMVSHSENLANLMANLGSSVSKEGECNDVPKPKVDPDAYKSESEDDEKGKDLDKRDSLPCPEEQEEQAIKAKYGKLKPKRPPLIAMDHEHAFFDSADWALGKQGSQKNKGPMEALRPKLQPSPHHHVRTGLSTYATEADDHEGMQTTGGHKDNDENCKLSDEDQIKDGFSDHLKET